MTTVNARRRDWSQHDAAIPFRDERLIRLNGQPRNPMRRTTGRTPVWVEPELQPANQNDRKDEAA